MPLLKAKLISSCFVEQIDKQVINELINIVHWKKIPSYQKMGRTAWLTPSKTVIITFNDKNYKILGFKIKGVGLCDHKNNITKPSLKPYFRLHSHLGFDKYGNFIRLFSDPSPLGGICFNKAKNEYDISLKLLNEYCPTELPILLYKYTNLNFSYGELKNEPLGVVISGITENTGLRFDSLLNFETFKNNEVVYKSWRTKLNIKGKNWHFNLISKIAFEYGKTLRKFHNSGFYRYSGQPDNYSYCNFLSSVFLLDLDTSCSFKNCSKSQIPYEIIRDTVSGVFGIFAYILRIYNYKYYTPQIIFKFNFFNSFIEGYFYELEPESCINEYLKIYKYYSETYKYAQSKHLDTKNSITLDFTDDFQEFRKKNIKQYWIKRDETLCVLFSILYCIYLKSSWQSIYKIDTDKNNLILKMENFCSKTSLKLIKKHYLF